MNEMWKVDIEGYDDLYEDPEAIVDYFMEETGHTGVILDTVDKADGMAYLVGSDGTFLPLVAIYMEGE